ncbi:hypothetical protein OPQ81_001812 [Rhizoctonia solani]|nr:hypothetical protein OPQ81_001812 [Rhizoctonia solani]
MKSLLLPSTLVNLGPSPSNIAWATPSRILRWKVVPGTESKGTPKERSYSGLARPANSAIDSQLRSEGLTRRAI